MSIKETAFYEGTHYVCRWHVGKFMDSALATELDDANFVCTAGYGVRDFALDSSDPSDCLTVSEAARHAGDAGAPPGPPPSARSQATERPAESNLLHGAIIMPPTIPTHIRIIEEESGPPQVGSSGPYVFGSTGSGDPNGFPHSLGNSSAAVVPPPPPAVAHPPRVSHMMEGNLIRRVQPEYPPIARSARIQGQVVLAAIISKEGTIENLRALAGHPILVHAALWAVRQWRYRPYILNNEPVEVETQITMNFSLSRN